MGVTPNHGYPYPDPGSPPDGPGAFYALAMALDDEGWTTYVAGTTHDITNFGGGSSTSFWRWREEAGLIHVQGVVTLGAGGGVFGDVSFNLPHNADLGGGYAPVSRVLFGQADSGEYQGALTLGTSVGNIRAMRAAGSYIQSTPLAAAVPFVWTSGGYLDVDALYVPA